MTTPLTHVYIYIFKFPRDAPPPFTGCCCSPLRVKTSHFSLTQRHMMSGEPADCCPTFSRSTIRTGSPWGPPGGIEAHLKPVSLSPPARASLEWYISRCFIFTNAPPLPSPHRDRRHFVRMYSITLFMKRPCRENATLHVYILPY